MGKILPLFFLSFMMLLSGCVPALVGAGVVTGFLVSNDSAAGNIRSTYRDVWDISLEVLRAEEAEITSAIESKGVIKAQLADEVAIVVKINTVDSETQRLKVAARKYYIPKPQFAQRIFFKIVREIE